MRCGYSKEILALFVEGDLPTLDASERVSRHVAVCADCREYCRQLQHTQSLIKSRFKSGPQQSINAAALASVRRTVMSRIDESQNIWGWGTRLERFLMLGLRRQRFALAGFAIAAVLSVSLVGQMQHSGSQLNRAAVFVGKDTLVRPEAYREWVFVGSSSRDDYFHNVYIDPSAYREYVSTGKFPEGTVMVLEAARSETKKEPGLQGSYAKEFVALQVSVKDSSRFDGGWGYFNFTDEQAKLKAKAIPEENGCRSCHQDRAETDHVFTQFYPVLKSARAAQL
jgi:hypothetical protein